MTPEQDAFEKLAIARGTLRHIARWCDDKGLAELALETWEETRPQWLQERMNARRVVTSGP